MCSGYHQKCHVPAIPDEVLDPSEEWVCTYCEQDIPCPYVVNQDEVVSVLYTSPERKRSKVSNNEEVSAYCSMCHGVWAKVGWIKEYWGLTFTM